MDMAQLKMNSSLVGPNLSMWNGTSNRSEMMHVDLYELYRTTEKEQLMMYKSVAYILGTLIILSNITVVVSSGLLLRKGQKQKSTYLLLGNVSLADTIVGFSLIFDISIDNSVSFDPLCIFQMAHNMFIDDLLAPLDLIASLICIMTSLGMIVSPAMVSIFSVGLIAVDRYIYILHGLYYYRWFSTTRVRIGILCIWLISLTLGFMPATGWVNKELMFTHCYYVALFPGALILLNSILSTIPVIIVAVLYSIILLRALKTVKELNVAVNNFGEIAGEKPRLRMYRGTVIDKKPNQDINSSPQQGGIKVNRSVSFNVILNNEDTETKPARISLKSKSADDLINDKPNTLNNYHDNKCIDSEAYTPKFNSDLSVYTVESDIKSSSHVKITSNVKNNDNDKRGSTSRKLKEPNKWRAITVVMLTSGSFIITWLPFFVAVIFFVFCEEKLTNPKCMSIRTLLGGPLATLAFLNSLFNPMIYAWWHKGFQRSVRNYYRKYLHKFTCTISK